MAGYLPHYTWLIDWDHDDYASPYADLSSWYVSHSVTWGSQVNLDGKGVSIASASGQLTILPEDGRYDRQASVVLNKEQLIRENPCKLVTSDGLRIWSGKARIVQRFNELDDRTVVFDLAGTTATKVLQNEVEFRMAPGTLDGPMKVLAARSGISILRTGPFKQTFIPDPDGGPDIDITVQPQYMPHGNLYFKGPPIQALYWLGQAGGGWMLEDNIGRWRWRRWTEAVNYDIQPTLTLAFGAIHGQTTVGERVGWVRNAATLSGWEWTPSSALTSVGTAQTTIRRGQTKWVTLRFQEQSSGRPVAVSNFTLKPSTEATLISTDLSNPSRPRARILGVSRTATAAVPVTLSAQASIDRRAATTPIGLTVTEFDSQQIYGRQVMKLPDWFGGVGGLAPVMRPWLRNLAEPPSLFAATYPERQDTKANHEALLSRCAVGRASDFEYTASNAIRTFEGLVLSITHSGNQTGEMYRTVRAIERKSLPEPPLSLDMEHISDRTAIAVIGTPSPAGEIVYLRYRKVGASAWLPTVEREATTIRTLHVITQLTENTSYEVEVARDSAFLLEVSNATFTTAQTVNNVALKTVRIGKSGALSTITAWDYTGNLHYVYPLLLDEQVNVQVQATAEDSRATVTVVGAPFPGINEAEPTVTITVENRADDPSDPKERVYTLRVLVTAPVDAEYDALAPAGNEDPRDIHSDGRTTWVLDRTDARCYAYDAHTKIRKSSNDIDLSSLPQLTNHVWAGITGNARNLYVMSRESADQARFYGLLKASLARAPELDFIVDNPSGTNRRIADGCHLEGRFIWLLMGTTGASISRINLNDPVINPNTRPTRAYQTVIPRTVWRQEAGIWTDNVKVYTLRSGLANQRPISPRVFQYDIEDAALEEPMSGYELVATNRDARGLWADYEIMLIPEARISSTDRPSRIFTYGLSDFSRRETTGISFAGSQDFVQLNAAGNNNPIDCYSDGVTMWVLDYDLDTLFARPSIYAYKHSDKTNDTAKNFGTALTDAGVLRALAITGDGITIWVADVSKSRLAAFTAVTHAHNPAKDIPMPNKATPVAVAYSLGFLWVVTDDGTGWVYNATTGELVPITRKTARGNQLLSLRYPTTSALASTGSPDFPFVKILEQGGSLVNGELTTYTVSTYS